MEHAYGLYTHIQSNRRRSIALLIGLFFLVYVMVYAGALAAEAFMGDASLAWLLARARQDFIAALPWATLGTLAWVLIAYKFHQSMIDAITGAREVTRQEEPRLWNLLENLCISRGITMPKLKVTEDQVIHAITTHGACSLVELQMLTEAGTGCTCCHRELRNYLAIYSPSSSPAICSAK